MQQNKIYNWLVSIIDNPNLASNWIFLEKSYREKTLLHEAESINFLIKQKFKEDSNVDDTNSCKE